MPVVFFYNPWTPEFTWCFQGVWKEASGIKWVNIEKFFDKSSIIRQKGELKTEVTRKQSTQNFLKKNEYFLPFDSHTDALLPY